jgi:methylated-DNA-[protein]-cysteine S-methyltransferase
MWESVAMTVACFAIFDTAIGACALAWAADGIVAVQLPERDRTATRSRIERRLGEAREALAPPGVQLAIADMRRLLRGDIVDLSRVALDMTRLADFDRRVYEAARTIGPGKTSIYGEIAILIGEPGAARAVGQALGRNPYPIVVPCHRVLAAGGKIGGFSAHGGRVTKLRLLTIERAEIGGAPTLFDAHGGLPFAIGGS